MHPLMLIDSFFGLTSLIAGMIILHKITVKSTLALDTIDLQNFRC